MSLVSEFLQKVGLIRNETQYHGNTKERVADTFETLFNLDVWFKKLDPQDPNANKIYQAGGNLVDLPEGGLDTDMSNLDDDLTVQEQETIKSKLDIQNIANTDLTTTAERTFTQGFTFTHQTDGKIYNVSGLPNKNVDENFRTFRVQDASGQQAIVEKSALYDTIPYRAISGSTIEPTIAELNAFGTDRVDFPNLNRVYLKMTGWKYYEVFDVV